MIWRNSCSSGASKLTPTPFWTNTILFICSPWLCLGSFFLQDSNNTSSMGMMYLVHFNYFFMIYKYSGFVCFNLRPSYLHCILRYVSNLRGELAAVLGLHNRNAFCCSITRENSCLECIAYWTTSFLPVRAGFYARFPGSSTSKEFTHSEGDLGSIPGLGRSPGKGNGYPLQYSGLDNSMDCMVHGVEKSQAQLSDFHFHFLLWYPLETPPNSVFHERLGFYWFATWLDLLLKDWKLVWIGRGGAERLGKSGPGKSREGKPRLGKGPLHMW